MPWFCQNAVFAVFWVKMPCFYVFTIVFCFWSAYDKVFFVWFNTKMFYLYLCYQSHCALLPWRHRRNMYFTFFWSWLMLHSDKILQKKTLHCMEWWSSMPDVEFYRLYNDLWACGLMLCLCCVFSMIFAIFTKVCRVFHHFLPWFFTVPSLGAL